MGKKPASPSLSSSASLCLQHGYANPVTPQHSWWATDQRRPASVGAVSASRLPIDAEPVPSQWPVSTDNLSHDSSVLMAQSSGCMRTRTDQTQTRLCQKLGLTSPIHCPVDST